jgi:hypothetical protein
MKVYVWKRSNGWRWQTECGADGAYAFLDKDDAIKDAERFTPAPEIIMAPHPAYPNEARI